MSEKFALTPDEKAARREYQKHCTTQEMKEKRKAYKRAWNKAHPDKWREYQKRFYAKLAAAASAGSESDKQ